MSAKHRTCDAILLPIKAACWLLALLLVAAAGPAGAHTVRFVASDGNDADDCTRNRPCLTLQRGIEQTPAGSELVVLDSGDFGSAATIEQSITISAVGVSAAHGKIIVNAPDATVVLRGLRLNGGDAVSTGLDVRAAGAVHVVDCVVQQFLGTGISVQIAGVTRLFVSGSVSRDNGFDGLFFRGGAGSTLAVDNSRFERNGRDGIDVQSNEARIVRSIVAGNLRYGFRQLGGETNITLTTSANNSSDGYLVSLAGQMTLEQSISRGNVRGLRVEGSSTARLSNSVVTNNQTGLSVQGGSTLLTRQSSTVSGNTTADVSGTLTILGGT